MGGKSQKGDVASGRSNRQCRLWWVVLASIGMALRNVRLAARGGGITPSWMLRVETLSFTACAISGTCALTNTRQAATAERATLVFGSLGATVHGMRLLLFLTRRRPAG